MLGVVLRELEGATPGLQDVPAIEVQEVSVSLLVLFTIAYYFSFFHRKSFSSVVFLAPQL